jgi:phosphopantothenoylcysteine decarboxylase / phosphopantothenate---cysteine ligase
MYLACCCVFEQLIYPCLLVQGLQASSNCRTKEQKIKKEDESFSITIVKNVDIAYEFGKIKTATQLSAGFALETTDELKHSVSKLDKKNFDIVILNSMSDEQATFGYDTNKISIIRNDLTQKKFPLKRKTEGVTDSISEIETVLMQKTMLQQLSVA